MPRGLPSAAVKRAYNLREKRAYHDYVARRGRIRGGQKGFRRLMRSRPVGQRPLRLLSPFQRSRRETALRVLGRSRRFNEPLSKAAREAHTSPDTVRRYLGGSGYRKVGGRWQPTDSDSLVRVMSSYEEGRRVRVVVRGSKTASKIGRYNRDVRTFLEDPARDPSVLNKWKGPTFKDAREQVHTFETNPAELRSAVERAETEFGAFDIYPEGGEDEAAFAEV
jgi:hypothetical protein